MGIDFHVASGLVAATSASSETSVPSGPSVRQSPSPEPSEAGPGIVVEVCVDSVQSASNAIEGGADRLELCGNLGLGGGTTPSMGLYKRVHKIADGIPIMVMIRPRTGDFLYSESELEVMVEDIRAFKRRGARGVVFGVLTKEGRVDIERTKVLVDEALPMEVCFHRAFDMTRDADEALRDVLSIGGVSRILTSGHSGTTAPSSIKTLKSLCADISNLTVDQPFPTTILPGSGVNPDTVGPLLRELLDVGVREVHLSGGTWHDSEMTHRREGFGMGVGGAGEWGIWTTEETKVRQVRVIADTMWFERELADHYTLDRARWRSLSDVDAGSALRRQRSTSSLLLGSVSYVPLSARERGLNAPGRLVEQRNLLCSGSCSCSARSVQATSLDSPMGNHCLILQHLATRGIRHNHWLSSTWWCLRHRLHHRFTDDPVQDPYAATRGLFYSHMGWIFFKPNYGKLEFVDRNDLDSDPVVRLQHKYYVPLALSLGLLLPTAIGSLWRDSLGAFVWAGLVSRLAIWHCTFLVNSLAHWEGLQPYSDEDTSRGNLLLAVLTSGEGNHNFHVRPSVLDWDPSKWVIILLHQLGLVRGLRRARKDDLIEALQYMQHKHEPEFSQDEEEWDGETWTLDEVREYAAKHEKRCTLVVNGFAVDVTPYLGEHPGGASLLRKYAATNDSNQVHDASWAFSGGLNNHSRAARKRLTSLAFAKLVDGGSKICT
ncbi:Copper homeostasis protein cutC [Pleurotus pulmonarius]